MVNKCTKFEVSKFTRYEAMDGGAKCRKWGGFGCHHSIKRIRHPIQLYRNYVSIFYRFRDVAGYLWKLADFDPPTPPAFGAPYRG